MDKEKKRTLKDILSRGNTGRYSTSVKYMVVAFVILLIVFFVMASGRNGKPTRKTMNGLRSKYQVVSTNLEVLSKKMNQKIIGLEKEQKKLIEGRKKMEEEIRSLKDQQKQISSQLDNLTESMKTIATQLRQIILENKNRIVTTGKQTSNRTVQSVRPPQRIFTINLPPVPKSIKNLSASTGKPKKTVVKKMWVSLPDGSVVKSTIISGIFAPVTSSQWLPTLLNLDEAFYGPNDTRVPLQGCKVLARAQGDYTTSRASVTAYEISCVLPDGKARVFKVKGYVADSKDSAYGVRGKIISKTGKFILGSVITSFIQGFSQGIAQSQTTQTVTSSGSTVTSVTGSATKYAGYSGTSSAFAKLANYYESRLNKMIDMIYVPSGKTVWLVIQKGCVLKGVSPSEFYGSNPFGGVD